VDGSSEEYQPTNLTEIWHGLNWKYKDEFYHHQCLNEEIKGMFT